MMSVQELYVKLTNTTTESQHLILSDVFKETFNRSLRATEWGFLRKLMRLYGAGVVFWALIKSSNIQDRGNPLAYVSRVCIGMLEEEARRVASVSKIEETKQRIAELRSYKRPNWEEILAS